MHSLGAEEAGLEEKANSLAGGEIDFAGDVLTSSSFQTQLIVHTCRPDKLSQLITKTCSLSGPKIKMNFFYSYKLLFLDPGLRPFRTSGVQAARYSMLSFSLRDVSRFQIG